jgi:hypothetical protein
MARQTPAKETRSFVIAGTRPNLPISYHPMIKKLLCGIIFGLCAAQAFAWTDGELLIWISDNRA